MDVFLAVASIAEIIGVTEAHKVARVVAWHADNPAELLAGHRLEFIGPDAAAGEQEWLPSGLGSSDPADSCW